MENDNFIIIKEKNNDNLIINNEIVYDYKSNNNETQINTNKLMHYINNIHELKR